MESETQKTLKQLFCTQLIEFMDDIISIFPNNLDLKTGKTFIVGLTKVSKKKLIGIWKTSVVDVYEEGSSHSTVFVCSLENCQGLRPTPADPY